MDLPFVKSRTYYTLAFAHDLDRLNVGYPLSGIRGKKSSISTLLGLIITPYQIPSKSVQWFSRESVGNRHSYFCIYNIIIEQIGRYFW